MKLLQESIRIITDVHIKLTRNLKCFSYHRRIYYIQYVTIEKNQ